MKGLGVMQPPLVEPTRPDDPELLYLSLDSLLPEAHRLAIQHDLGLVAHLYADVDSTPRLQHVQWFTLVEMAMVLALVEQHPHYCPYEVLFAHFTSTRVSEQAYEERESEVWDVLMRPMRKGIVTDIVERIPIRQLGLPEQLLLLRSRQEFELGGEDLLHRTSLPRCLAGTRV